MWCYKFWWKTGIWTSFKDDTNVIWIWMCLVKLVGNVANYCGISFFPLVEKSRNLQVYKLWQSFPTISAHERQKLFSLEIFAIIKYIEILLRHCLHSQWRTSYSNITSFFRFVDKRAIYRWYNLIRTCAGECDCFSIGSINCVRHFPLFN
jgi:hypothetical protein